MDPTSRPAPTTTTNAPHATTRTQKGPQVCIGHIGRHLTNTDRFNRSDASMAPASLKCEVGAEIWSFGVLAYPEEESSYRVVPIEEDSAAGHPVGADQRCDGDEDEHCAMIACVESSCPSGLVLGLGFLGGDPAWGAEASAPMEPSSSRRAPAGMVEGMSR